MTNPYDDLVAKTAGPAAPSDNPYDALVQAEDTRLRASAMAASGRNPDAYAKANQIAARNGWPVDIVADSLPEFEERERYDALDKVQQDHPEVGEFLTDPRRMALAGDDLDGMTRLASAFKAAPADVAKSRGFTGLVDRWLNLPTNAPIRGLMRAGLGSSFQQGDVSAVASLVHTATDTLDQATMAPLRGAFDGVTAIDPETGEDRTAEMMATLDPAGLQRMAQESAGVVREVQADQQAQAATIGARPTIEAFRADPVKATEQFFAYYGNQGAQSLPAMLLAIATRNPEVGGAVMGATTGAQDYTGLRLQGVDRGRAGIAAAGSAATEAALGAAGLSATRGARALTTGPLVESGTEALTTWAQTDLQDWATGNRTPIEDKLSATLDAAIVGYGFGLTQAGGSMTVDATVDGLNRSADQAVELGQRVMRSAESSAQLQAITAAATDAKLSERSPADLEAFVAQTGGDGNVYLDAAEARILFQSDYVPLQDMVGGADALAEQMASGDLAIPMAKWASVVSRMPNRDDIVRHGRMRADDLSAAELESFNPDEVIGGLNFEDTGAAADRAAPGESTGAQQIQQDVVGQLTATGRYTPAAAEAQAKVWSGMFTKMAELSGQDPKALYDRYMAGINDGTNKAQSTRPFQGNARLDALIDSIRTPEAGNARQMFGPSLSSFLVAQGGIQDQGGELRARDAGKLRPGLVSGQGQTLDRARELAVERGYLPADADLNAFIDALDADLRGQSVYSEGEGNRERQSFDLERQQLLDAITENETLRDMPAEEFAKLTNQQILEALEGSTFDQAAYHGTPHTVDRFSLQKIGTGEGAQAFGWGLYFAGKRSVAEHYRDRLSDGTSALATLTVDGENVDPDSPEGHGARLVFHNGKPEMKRLAKQMLADAVAGEPYAVETAERQGLTAVEYYQRVADTIDRVSKRGVKITRGNLYQVELPEDSELLDNEGKITAQNDKVQEVARAFLREAGYLREGDNGPRQLASAFSEMALENGGMVKGADGQLLYEVLTKKLGSAQAASQYLNEHGIPGLKFKAGQIAQVGNSGTNYVIWDESAISEPVTLFQSAVDLDFGGRSDTELDAQYDAMPGTDGGRVLDTDLVRELSPEYRADKTLSPLIHKAASAFTKARFLRMLAKPVAEGRDNAVMFTAGGGGSGKSTAVKNVLGESNADITYDGTLSNLTRARADIEAALESGREVRIVYVYRSPANSVSGAIGRAVRSRRPVPVGVLAEAHANAAKVAKTLAQEYAGDARVTIIAINNDGEAGKAERMSISAVPEVNQDEAESIFRAALEESRASGAVDDALYAAFDGRTANPEVGASDSRQSQSEREGASRNPVTQDPAAGGVSASAPPSLFQRAANAVRSLFQADTPQTETPAFKRWFGDSKVVDADGRPLVVYHGTTHAERIMGEGFKPGWTHLTDSKEVADSYQDWDRGGSPDTLAVYAKAENPAYFDAGGQKYTDIGNKVFRATADAERAGHDALIIRNIRDNADSSVPTDPHTTVITFRPEQIKSATGNSGAFDPADPSILNQQPNPEGPRGQIQIFPDKRMSISLFEKADRSTFMHESAHFFLEVMRDLAAQPDANPKLTADMGKLLVFFGVESAAQIETKHHEMFARAFEKYLGEGKAPSPELQPAFSAFKAWIISVYKSLVALDVNLTDDVRGVFDRMLATEAQIEAAQARQNMVPMVSNAAEAGAIGLTAKQFADYETMLAAATEEAKAETAAKLIKAHDRARQKWWKEELAAVRAEVEAEYEATPVFRAARILGSSKTMADGTPKPEGLAGLKLDKAATADRYGDEYLKRLAGLYRVDGGTHPDVVAGLLGFPSGDALIKALANRGDLAARVDAEANERMRLRHGDPMTDGTLAEVAMDAVHNAKRVKLLQYELNLLAELAGQPRADRRLLKAAAQYAIASKTARQLRPNDYLAAERKAAKQATDAAAKGDYAAALLAKRQQAFNAALYSEAKARLRSAEQKIAFLKKAGTDKTRKRVGKSGKSYVDALDALMEGHELRTVSGTTVARRDRLRAWVARVQEFGSNTSVSEELLARVESERVTNVADLTFAQLDDLHESVKNLLHLARMKNLLRTKQGTIKWKDAKRQLVERLEQQQARGGDVIGEADRTALGMIAELGRAVGNWVLQPETIVEWLDGGTSGPWHDILWEPSEDVEHVREALQRKVGALLQQAFDAIPAADRKALDQTHSFAWASKPVSGHTILAALMNAGNEGNYTKLLQGGFVDGEQVKQFTPEMLQEMFATLTASQANLVQGVWDAVNSLWPDIVALEEKMNGFAPPKIEPRGLTVQTKDGPVELRGGYFPVKYDPRGSKAGALADDEQAKRVLAGQGPIRATTSKGHTVKRTEFTAPLLLDYHRVLSQHLDGVMGDIAYREFLPQVYRVLNDPELARMVHARLGPGAIKALKLAFERGAVGATPLAGPLFGPLQGTADNTLTNISSAALGLRVPLALANTVTAPMLATARVSPKFVAAGFFEYYKNPSANARMVHALSPMMLKRSEARSMDLRNVLTNLRGKYGLRRQMIELSMSVHQWIVPLAENAIWMGAYKQAQAGGADATESVRMADKAIRQTQTKHTMKDLATAEGNPYLRPLMQFVGPLVIVNNRLQESGLRGLRGDVTSPIQAVGVWLAMAAGGAWAFELLMGRGADDDDDDGDVGVDDWSWWAAKKLALLPFAAYPILREAAAKLDSGFSRPNPLVDAANRIIKFGATAYDSGAAIFNEDEEVDTTKLAKDAVGAAGVAVGVPSNQLVRTGTYLVEVSTGEHTPTNPAAEAVYLLQGPPKEE